MFKLIGMKELQDALGEQKHRTNANDKHTNEEFVCKAQNIFNIFAVICRIFDVVRAGVLVAIFSFFASRFL